MIVANHTGRTNAMYKAILFDLDGTLLPMDLEEFTKGYLTLLAREVAPLGYKPEALVKAMWQGVAAMVSNDGTKTNEARFWEVFSGVFGEQVYDHIPAFDRFYSETFHQAKRFTGENLLAQEAVRLAREKAGCVILATNPIFPLVAVRARLSWVGLRPEDFDFVTTYENSSRCKPDPAYYHEILTRHGLKPDECLMIGNDTREDMLAGAQAGMDTYLITDCRIDREDAPYTGPQGDFSALVDALKQL